MNQFSTVSSLFNQLISENELLSIADKHNYVEEVRKFGVRNLIDFLLAAALEKWSGYRDGADKMAAVKLKPVNHSTISKKAGEVPFELMKDVFHLLVSRCNRARRRSKAFKHALLLIDSTTITVGETCLPWAPFHGKRSGIKLHVSYTPSTEMPLEVKETTGLVHDGPAGVSLANNPFILVEDRAYGKHTQLDAHQKKNQRFVIRLKENIAFHRPYSLTRTNPDGSTIVGDITCQLGTEQARTKNRFRVVSFTDREGHVMQVATNVMDVSAEAIADMYKARWEIESFFQWIKGQLNVKKLFGKTKNAVFSQLFAGLIAYILIKWMHEQVKKKTRKPLSLKSFCRCLLNDTLPMEWKNAKAEFFYRLRERACLNLPIFG